MVTTLVSRLWFLFIVLSNFSIFWLFCATLACLYWGALVFPRPPPPPIGSRPSALPVPWADPTLSYTGAVRFHEVTHSMRARQCPMSVWCQCQLVPTLFPLQLSYQAFLALFFKNLIFHCLLFDYIGLVKSIKLNDSSINRNGHPLQIMSKCAIIRSPCVQQKTLTWCIHLVFNPIFGGEWPQVCLTFSRSE